MHDTARDQAALQGTWEQVSVEVDGVVDPPDAYAARGTLTIILGDTFRVQAADGRRLLHGRFELDATRVPKSITWIDAIGADRDKRLPAIYVLDGDHFTFIAADADAPRPTVFRTVPGLTMRRFVRRTSGSA